MSKPPACTKKPYTLGFAGLQRCNNFSKGEKKRPNQDVFFKVLAEEVRFEERAQITQVIDSKGLARPVKPYGTFLAQSTQDIGTKKQA